MNLNRKHDAEDEFTTPEIYRGTNSQGRFINQKLNDNFNLNADLTSIYVGDFNDDGLDDISNTVHLLLAKTKWRLQQDYA